MASTYVNDLRLEEIADGEQSGTWGATTNTNLELIGEALGFGTEGITTNADTHTSTVADGAADAARAMYIKYTGTLDSACTITIAPNTLSRMHFIENGTSGSQNILISQGSGANVTIPPGDTKAVYLDGAGSGAAVVDAFASLSVVDLKVQDDLTVTDDATIGGRVIIDDTTDATSTTDGSLQTDGGLSVAKDTIIGNDLKLLSDSAVLVFGAGSDATLTHTNDVGLTLNSTNKLMFNDASQFIQGSSATVLSIGATNEIDLTATAIDINGTVDISSTLAVGNTITVTENNADASTDIVILNSNGVATVGNQAKLHLGATGSTSLGASIIGEFTGTADANHATDLIFKTTTTGSSLTEVLRIDSRGNAGLGVIPESGWSNSWDVLQVGLTGSLSSIASGSICRTFLSDNCYNNGSSHSTDWQYQIADEASQYVQKDGSHRFRVAGAGSADADITWTDAVIIHNGGQVSIGTTSSTFGFNVGGSGSDIRGIFQGSNQYRLALQNGTNDLVYLGSGGADNFRISKSDGSTMFEILSFGAVLIGTGNGSPAEGTTAGTRIGGTGATQISVDGQTSLLVNRVQDGSIVDFRSAGTSEGTISISGTTTSYNGGHLSRWSRLLDNSKDTSIVKGTVMTNLNEMVEWGDEANEQLNKMAVSSVDGDANVAGVFVNWDNDDDWNDMNVAMTGDMVIRIAQGTTVARGDLLISAGDGTAKTQDDDIVRSKTIAKVTSTNVSHTYDDGTYLVPCVLMAC